MDTTQYTLFQSYPDAFSANIVKGLLESYGIPAMVADGNVIWGTAFFNDDLGGVRLYVRHEDVDKATALLASENAAQPGNDD